MAFSSQAVNSARCPERMSESVIRTSSHDVYQSTEQSGNGSSKHCGEPHWFIRQERIHLLSEADPVSSTTLRIQELKIRPNCVFFFTVLCFEIFSKRLGYSRFILNVLDEHEVRTPHLSSPASVFFPFTQDTLFLTTSKSRG